MARVNFASDFGESPRSTRLLASAYSCAQRLQLSLEGLGGVSNLLALTGVGTGLVVEPGGLSRLPLKHAARTLKLFSCRFLFLSPAKSL